MWAFLRLAAPMVVSRAGLAAMGIADGIMVARYDAREFASLSLADGTIGRLLDVFVALLIGALAGVPRHVAHGDPAGSRHLWRRTLPVAVLLGTIGLLAGLGGTTFLRAIGQPGELAEGAGPVMTILGLGHPAALLAIGAALYLEGMGRPARVAAAIVGANVLNVGLNWVFIGGHLGAPALGAQGSAIATTAVRMALAIALLASAWRLVVAPDAPTVEQAREREASRRAQWRLGLGAAGTVAMMVGLGASLTVFAGWLGVLPLATFAAAWNLAAPAGLLALGMADATGIRVAAAAGRGGDRAAGALILGDLRYAVGVVLVLALGLALGAGLLASLYTRDAGLRTGMASVVPFVALILVFDSVGFVMGASLRALRDAAWPAAIEIGSMALLVPIAASLAIGHGQGVRGLFVASAIVACTRATLLGCRAWWRTGRAAGTVLAVPAEVRSHVE